MHCLWRHYVLFIAGEANKQVSEYKLKLQKSEQDLAAFHANVSDYVDVELLKIKYFVPKKCSIIWSTLTRQEGSLESNRKHAAKPLQ